MRTLESDGNVTPLGGILSTDESKTDFKRNRVSPSPANFPLPLTIVDEVIREKIVNDHADSISKEQTQHDIESQRRLDEGELAHSNSGMISNQFSWRSPAFDAFNEQEGYHGRFTKEMTVPPHIKTVIQAAER